MTEQITSIDDVKAKWLEFQKVRDSFESQTYELRKRYVNFMHQHFLVPKGYNWKVTPELHLEVLNPEDFDKDLLFVDRDSIFGIEHHRFPVGYLENPDKWEADRLAQVQTDRAKDARREMRLKMQRMQYMREELYSKNSEPYPYYEEDNVHSEEWQAYIQTVKDLILRELDEANGRTTQPNLVEMLHLAYHVKKDHVLMALLLAEQDREVIRENLNLYLPESHPDYEYPEEDKEGEG